MDIFLVAYKTAEDPAERDFLLHLFPDIIRKAYEKGDLP